MLFMSRLLKVLPASNRGPQSHCHLFGVGHCESRIPFLGMQIMFRYLFLYNEPPQNLSVFKQQYLLFG